MMSKKSTVPTLDDLIEEGILSEEDAAIVGSCISERSRIKVAENELDEEKRYFNSIFEDISVRCGVSSVKGVGGTFSRVETTKSSLDKLALAQALISRGVPASVIEESLEEATTVKSYTSVTFRAAKGAK